MADTEMVWLVRYVSENDVEPLPNKGRMPMQDALAYLRRAPAEWLPKLDICYDDDGKPGRFASWTL